MSTLLRINSSPRYGGSVSRQLTGAFVAQWKSLRFATVNFGQDRRAYFASYLQAVQTHAQLV